MSSKEVAEISSKPPPLAANAGPRNCHEAALCWLIYSLDKGDVREYSGTEIGDWDLWRYCRERFFVSKVEGAEPDPKNMIKPPWVGKVYSEMGFSPLVYEEVQDPCLVLEGEPVAVGDLVIFGPSVYPAHSMVVEKVDEKGTWLRGFNNYMTFKDAPAFAYDGTLRCLEKKNMRLIKAGKYCRVIKDLGGDEEVNVARYSKAAARLRALIRLKGH